MDDIRMKTMKLKARDLQVAVRIGKNTVTDTMLEEIDRQLKKNKLIKIKFLRAAMENLSREEMISKIMLGTRSSLVEKKGNTFVIYRS